MVRNRAREIEKVEGRVRWMMKMCELPGRVVGGKGRGGRAWGGRDGGAGRKPVASLGRKRNSICSKTHGSLPGREPGPGNLGDFFKGEITTLCGGG